MLNTPPASDGLHLCSICDGIDAVMLFAAYFSRIPTGGSRTDLSMPEALDYLQRYRGGRFDRIILVPNAGKTAAPRLLQALIAEAARHTSEVLVLLPRKSRLQVPDAAGTALKVLYGPPFDDASGDASALGPDGVPEHKNADQALSGAGGPATGFLKRILMRKSKRAPSAAEPVPSPGPPPGRDLPEGLNTIMVLPVCGGTGATTFAVNIAAELAQAEPGRSVCLIDLNLQYGNVATYAGLPANTGIMDAYRGIDSLDSEAFELCLRQIGSNLHVFAGPGEILPADGITAAHLSRIISLARSKADLVVVDLPHQVPDWCEAAFEEASVVLAMALLDVRSAQNLAKLRDLLRSEGLASGKIRCLLNRAPAKRSQLWEDARARLEKDNEFGIYRNLPDGGDAVSMACNAGIFLMQHDPGNAFRLALRDLATEILAHAGSRALSAPEIV